MTEPFREHYLLPQTDLGCLLIHRHRALPLKDTSEVLVNFRSEQTIAAFKRKKYVLSLAELPKMNLTIVDVSVHD